MGMVGLNEWWGMHIGERRLYMIGTSRPYDGSGTGRGGHSFFGRVSFFLV
jgi:hypothetical protein